MNDLNYAEAYGNTLAQAFPYVLNFGALYESKNNSRFRISGGKTVELPVISTSGRVDADRDSITESQRNYENAWETKTLSHQRQWSTLVHPQDIDQTNYAASIANITRVFNDEHKFPEMDAYTVSTIYKDWTAEGKTPTYAKVSADNLLSVFDGLMQAMTEARIPVDGRILYVTPAVMNALKNIDGITRSFNVKTASGQINRNVTTLDGVTVVEVPSVLMRTAYDFSDGWAVAEGAKQIDMLLIHPDSVITPVSYQFARLDPPSAVTSGKYLYYEESFEDVFILNNRADGIAFVVEDAE